MGRQLGVHQREKRAQAPLQGGVDPGAQTPVDHAAEPAVEQVVDFQLQPWMQRAVAGPEAGHDGTPPQDVAGLGQLEPPVIVFG